MSEASCPQATASPINNVLALFPAPSRALLVITATPSIAEGV